MPYLLARWKQHKNNRYVNIMHIGNLVLRDMITLSEFYLNIYESRLI